MPYRILRLLLLCLFATTVVHAQPTPNLVVAYLKNDDLRVWRAVDNSTTIYTVGEPFSPYLSPDGQYIAYTTARTNSIWLVVPDNPEPIEILPQAALAENGSRLLGFSLLEWSKDNNLYFTTFVESPTHYRKSDVWVVNAKTLSIEKFLPSTESGILTLSPDYSKVAISQPGKYDETEGSIRLLDVQSHEELTRFTFPAVSTASSIDFYPIISWSADSQYVNVAIPDKDLIYYEKNGPITLWRLGLDASQTQLGEIEGSFFGLPQWSDDGQHIFYVSHNGPFADNIIDLYTANGDGSNPIYAAGGKIGAIKLPNWIAHTHLLYYRSGVHDTGQAWLAEPGQSSQPFAGTYWDIQFVDSSTYVFVGSPDQNDYGFYYNSLNSNQPVLIDPDDNYIPRFDAVLIPPPA
ncbi:MAG: WD40 repeat domain-containing protein [Chloroflexi bacterium]|nr:WD40 repeat domain-containing protein [Chloroflexota bacterium]MCC6892365.1 WD40 repeat domain-containing protein [Anaerolineae bacterium]